jgi:hypothetical protein
MPQIFQYADIHEKYGNYTNFGGDVEGGADTGYIAVSYHQLLSTMPEGTSYENYIWGVNIKSTSSEYQAKIKSIKLINSKGEVVSEIKPMSENVTLTGMKEANYTFNLGGELKSYRVNGEYAVKSVSENKYFSIPGAKLTLVSDASKATQMNIVFNEAANNYYITLANKDQYVFDISGNEVKAGVEIKINAKNAERDTQTWKLKDNGDGTYSIYLEKTGDGGRYFAFGIKGGKAVLVTGADVEKYGKFEFIAESAKGKVEYDVKTSGTTVNFKVTAVEKNLKFTKVVVTNAAGTNVAEETVNAATFEKAFTLEKGTYTINCQTDRHSYIYVVTVK